MPITICAIYLTHIVNEWYGQQCDLFKAERKHFHKEVDLS